MSNVKEHSATPNYARGDLVDYIDHHNRSQIGEVLSIEASWPSYSKAPREPYLIYTVRHPTYRNKLMYIGENGIVARRPA